ncbi:histidine kinase, partial [Streptomyces antimycoticus]
MRIPHPRSLAGQLFAMQVVLVAALVAGCAVFAYVTDREQAVAAARQRATATTVWVITSLTMCALRGTASSLVTLP